MLDFSALIARNCKPSDFHTLIGISVQKLQIMHCLTQPIFPLGSTELAPFGWTEFCES
jgi:hypothetical protein